MKVSEFAWGPIMSLKINQRPKDDVSDDDGKQESDIKPIIWEIDGYVREMGYHLHPKIVPSGINQIIYMFYHPVC